MATSDHSEELFEIAKRLGDLSQKATAPEVKEPLERLEEAAASVRKASKWLLPRISCPNLLQGSQAAPAAGPFQPRMGDEGRMASRSNRG